MLTKLRPQLGSPNSPEAFPPGYSYEVGRLRGPILWMMVVRGGVGW